MRAVALSVLVLMLATTAVLAKEPADESSDSEAATTTTAKPALQTASKHKYPGDEDYEKREHG